VVRTGAVLAGEHDRHRAFRAVWDDNQREAWFLISDQPAGRQRVQQYAWRMRMQATFEDARESWLGTGNQLD
jgi:hypothetical protein